MSDEQWASPGEPPPSPPPGWNLQPPDPPAFQQPAGPTQWLQLPSEPSRPRPWVFVVALLVVLLVVLAGAVSMFSELAGPSDFDEVPFEPVVPDRPPSQRGELPATTLPQVVDEQDLTSEAARSGADFVELTCQFTGTSILDNPLSMDPGVGAPPNQMKLEPGAAFDCSDGTEASTGTIELSAGFDQLSYAQGIGSGAGLIRWTELPESRRVPGRLAPVSTTGVEVQLELPVIIVWTTILDGPYAGYRGRLVLRDWEPVFGEGGITGTRFARTSTTFTPS